MKNSEYWEKRLANEVWNQYNSLEEKNMAILNMYQKAEKDIIAEIAKLKSRGRDLTRSQKYRINHLNSLKSEINKICDQIGEDVEHLTKQGVFDAIKNNQENIGKILESSFSKPGQKAMEQMLNTPWHGSYFSERLWSDTGKLANELNDIVKRGITQGKTIAEMSFQLSNRLNKSMNDTHRLVRTETINTLNRSSLDGYRKSDVRYIRWWAAQDERECEICGANHDRIYPIDKAPILPCHPNCRCTYIPVLEDELTGEELMNLTDSTDIIIDKFTPCLQERKTGRILQTQCIRLNNQINEKAANHMKEQGWKFDWSLPQKMGADIYALTLEDDKVIQGLISAKLDKKSKFIYVPIVEAAPHNVGSKGKFEGVGGHLFAIACERSFDEGFEGFVSFKPKSSLKEHYIKTLGAKELPNGNLYIDSKNAKILVDKYIKKGGKK